MLSQATLEALLAFRRARDWEQFHSPRNLAVAISVEAGELLEHFQWMRDGEVRPSGQRLDEVALEIADIAIVLSYLAADLGIDVDLSVRKKLDINEARYPVSKSRGSAAKYDAL